MQILTSAGRAVLKSRYRADWLVVLLYGVLAIVFTWPLALYIDQKVIGPPMDNLEYVWRLWWVAHAVFERHISPFFQPDIYYPFGYPLAYSEITPAHSFLFAPVTLLLGPVLTYNLMIVCSAPVNGWVTYRFARRLLDRFGGQVRPPITTLSAFFVGAVFTFCAYRQFRILGHLPLIDTQWLVIAVWGLDRWIESRRVRDALLMAAGISLATLGSWYYAFMLAILLPVYLLVRVGDPRPLLRASQVWRSAGACIAVIAVTCVPFMLPYIQLASQDKDILTVPLADAEFWSASPIDYLVPNPRHPLWGPAVQPAIWPFPIEIPLEFASVSIGLTVLLFGLWGWKTASGLHWRALKWLGAVALILSFGPILHLSRFPLGIPLPAMALRLLPVANGIRTWGRFSIFVMLVASLLAGVGLMQWASSLARPRVQVVSVIIVTAVALFESATVHNLIPVAPRPVDEWLAAQPGDFAIMQYPLEQALTGAQMWYTRYHGKKIVYGYGTYLPLVYLKRHPVLTTFPADAALDQLAAWNVRYVLVDIRPSQTGVPFDVIDAQPRLRRVTVLGDEVVYELLK